MDLESEYNNRARVANHEEIFAAWEKQAAAFRATVKGRQDLAYGPHERHRCDVFFPDQETANVMAVFIHGGYWQSLDRKFFSHLANSLLAKGVAVAMPSYRLSPEASVDEIIDDMRACCLWLNREFNKDLLVAGHSAGGHLAAAMIATDWPRLGAPAAMVKTGMGISGIYDLRPLIATSINDKLNLDEPSALEASPLNWLLPYKGKFEVWVGGQESSEFHRQSHSLAAVWRGLGMQIQSVASQDKDHFTVINDLADPTSGISCALQKLAV